jgi:hypothetical protein
MNPTKLSEALPSMTPPLETSSVNLEKEVEKAVVSLLDFISNSDRKNMALVSNLGIGTTRFIYNDSLKPTPLQSTQPVNPFDFIQSYYADIRNGFYSYLESLKLDEDQTNLLLQNFVSFLGQIDDCLTAIYKMEKDESLFEISDYVRSINIQNTAIHLALKGINDLLESLPQSKEVEG